MSAAQPSPNVSELEQAVRDALSEQGQLKHWRWSPVLLQAYSEHRDNDARRTMRYLQVVGLVVTILSFGIDLVAIPDHAAYGIALRAALVVPAAALGAIFAMRWDLRILKILCGWSVSAFAASVVHLAGFADPLTATRYTMSAVLLLGTAGLLLPFLFHELVAFLLLFCAATLAAAAWPHPMATDMLLQHAALTIIVAGSVLAIGVRNGMLRVRAFLFGMRDKFVRAELEHTVQVLRELSEKDGLTGLANRRAFRSVFAQEYVPIDAENPRGVSLLMIDLDHFKEFNDRFGHPAGDRALRAVARCLEQTFSQHGGHVARFGGEEFVGVIHCHSGAEAEVLGEKLCAEIRALKIPVRQHQMQSLTTSIGVASTGAGAEVDLSSLTARADRALYHAKDTGRDRVVVSERIELRVDRLAG